MEGGRPKMRLIVAPHERQKLFDESEQDGVAGDNADYFDHTIGEIVISEAARQSGGQPFASAVNFTHSSDLRSMENIFTCGSRTWVMQPLPARTIAPICLARAPSAQRTDSKTRPRGDCLKSGSAPGRPASGWFSRSVSDCRQSEEHDSPTTPRLPTPIGAESLVDINATRSPA